MKKTNAVGCVLCILTLLFTTSAIVSCKGKDKKSTETTVTNTVTDTPATTTPTPPVTISGDDELRRGVTDATKDYPNVKAAVADSVITLTGEIKRADWQKLNPTLNSLHPKRVNSANLTIK
ncbi:MAG: hypothetical protein JWP81_3302 [Ferruginibacter sp.]|nr:hypothetical protein [Ferruginibacter sp.]